MVQAVTARSRLWPGVLGPTDINEYASNFHGMKELKGPHMPRQCRRFGRAIVRPLSGKWESGGLFRGSARKHRRCCESRQAFPFTGLTLPRKILCWKQARTDESILIGVSAVSFYKASKPSRLGLRSTTASSRSARLLAVASHRIRIQPAYIRRDYLVPRTRVTIRHGEKSLEAMVSFLPIY
jgi:hypothetical protein